MARIKKLLSSENVGFVSRIDKGSLGYRRGLLQLAFNDFAKENVRFVVLCGGLVSYPALKAFIPKDPLERETFILELARELSEEIPQLKDKNNKFIKIYIVTSPSTTYDSWLGKEVAQHLHALRPNDIFYWGEESVRFPLKNQHPKDFWVLVPRRASWRGDYFSTQSDRLIKDKQKQSSQHLPSLWVTACSASSLMRPQGEMSRPYISVPALHKLQEITTSENQVGVRVVEFFKDSDEFLTRTYAYKDFINADYERSLIPMPANLSKVKKDILDLMVQKGPMTIGMFRHNLPYSEERIAREIEAINASGFVPKIEYEESSELYQFSMKWFQNELRYTPVPEEEISEDSMVTFSCLHAGSIFTEYEYFTNQVPELILRRNVKYLVGCGDFIEGLKHNLANRGEVISGMMYSDHETLSARLIGTVMLKVFKARLDKIMASVDLTTVDSDFVNKAVLDSLIYFKYRWGNHDEWVAELGYRPLAHFHTELVEHVKYNLIKILNSYGVSYDVTNIFDITNDHILHEDSFCLPSGLRVDTYHPHMARAQTASLRSQATMNVSDSPVALIGNFHVAIAVEQWDPGLGQRVAIQLGSIVWMTGFEASKLKRLDVGVAYLKVKHVKGRILQSEIMFYNTGLRNKVYDTPDPVKDFSEELKLEK